MTKMAVWKNGLETKGLKVNMGKTKVMISGRDLHTLQTSVKYRCAVCGTGVRKDSIFCSGCLFWIYKCSDIPGRLVEDPDLGNWWKTLCWSPTYWWKAWCSWKFCLSWWLHLSRWRSWAFHSAWGKFRELLPFFNCKAISLNARGQIYKGCVRRTMLYSSECWALRQEDKKCLVRSEIALLLRLCSIKKEQLVSTNSLLSRLKLKSLDSVLRCNRLRCFGHVKQSELYTGKILDLEVKGNRSRDCPKKCWLDAIKDNLRQWNLQAETYQNRSEWEKVRVRVVWNGVI